MADLLCNCFRTYIYNNWNETNASKPDIYVTSKDETPAGSKSTGTKKILIHQGRMQSYSMDVAERYWGWRTEIFFKEISDARLQMIITEFERLIFAWEQAGGGTFSTDDVHNMKVIDDWNGTFGYDHLGNYNLDLRSFTQLEG